MGLTTSSVGLEILGKTAKCKVKIDIIYRFRPTHLLESHVSGQMVKKEVTDEGEVRAHFSNVSPLKVFLNLHLLMNMT